VAAASVVVASVDAASPETHHATECDWTWIANCEVCVCVEVGVCAIVCVCVCVCGERERERGVYAFWLQMSTKA